VSAGRALLLGGTGFLGRHLLAGLGAAGWETVVVTRQPALARAETVLLAGNQPVRVQLAAALADLRPALVVNAAGQIWRPDPVSMTTANVVFAEALALALADSRCGARLVHLGSSLEYGPVPAPQAIDEDARTAPRTAYGRSKLAGTERILRIAAGHGLDVVVLRVFNAIGAAMSESSVLGQAVASLVRARSQRQRAELALLDLRQYRDYVDARDVAGAVLATARLPRGSDRRDGTVAIFNIGSAVARTAEELVRALAELSQVDYRLTKVAVPEGEHRSADADWQLADTGRAERQLGWTAAHLLPDTLSQIWRCAAAEQTSFHPHRVEGEHHD
jgi:nucleoside-diphosphate-sugar epimerase